MGPKAVDPLAAFHPAVRTWFRRNLGEPTEAQARGWPLILSGRDTLIAAPTGSGKTLAAFLAGIDRLWRQGEQGALEDAIDVVYVSPLKALSHDVHRNLEAPLAGIAAVARELGLPEVPIRVGLRTGDTPASARRSLVRQPPHILVTTPESLYLMLTAPAGREALRRVRTVIVDEVHALVRDKRGSHLALSLARLDHLCGRRPTRVGLSATQRPIETIARFLVGSDRVREDGLPDCDVVDLGHQRELDLAVEVPQSDLQAVGSSEQWNDLYDRLAELIEQHRTTLVFVNTRRWAERVAHHLGERLGEARVSAHHGSLSKERRQQLEARLKAGGMKALVATASLELGIDVGYVDLVCQIDSPRSIAAFLQRVGRSGHALGLVPKGRLFPTSRDQLVECAALVRAVRAGRLDEVHPPVAPLDVLAQQIVAECACEPWHEDDLFALVRRAAPYAGLDRAAFDRVIDMLSNGYGSGGGRVPGHLHRDRLLRVVRGRRGARLAAIENGGAIPDVADYRVVEEPGGTFVGTVDEDFAVESMAGDVFLLGSSSWRIRRVEAGTVRVEDAQGAPPTLPFWLGEAPARTDELSREVADLRREIAARLDRGEDVGAWLMAEAGLDAHGAGQLVDYVRAAKQSLGLVPTETDVVFERFFDEAGGMQLVVHAPLGGRVNRAWGLALRKQFCRTFDFELQAAATDDGFVLSLGPQHSFPLADVFRFVTPVNAEEALTQALLNSPMFTTRWRWNATRALAVPRRRRGRRVPPHIQRMRAEDLLAAVFPQKAACQENVTWPIDLPDHPLVRQTVSDCLHEAMDLDGLVDLLRRVEEGKVRLHARDTTEPSPFAHAILNARPYAFLDDAPLEERRARAVAMRRTLPENGRDLGELDAAAIQQVREEARPQPRNAEELHEALLGLVTVRAADAAGWEAWFAELVAAGRAAAVRTAEGRLWFAAEYLRFIERLHPGGVVEPPLKIPPDAGLPEAGRDDAVAAVVRGHLECRGPVTVQELARRTALPPADVTLALTRLEGEGVALRGRFSPGAAEEEWCERRLLARIHRYTLDRLRREIEPVSTRDFLRFLLRWQHVAPGTRLEGKRGLLEAIRLLQGFEAPAAAWERDLLPARVAGYRSSWLDELCLSGEVTWLRLSPGRPATNGARAEGVRTATPIALVLRADLPWLLQGVRGRKEPAEPAAGPAREVFDLLRQRGALFFDDLVAATRQLPSHVERALRELVARGLVTNDGFQALRRLAAPDRRMRRDLRGAARFGSARPRLGIPAGRWAVVPRVDGEPPVEELAERWAWQLLARYGVVFRALLGREPVAVPWYELLRALRRLEARGQVRGGRFVEGFHGEQYALPEAVDLLRRVRRQELSGESVVVSAADPLNLIGVVTPGPKLPALATNALVCHDGLPHPVEPAPLRRNDTRGKATGG